MTKKLENKLYHKAKLIATLKGTTFENVLILGCRFCRFYYKNCEKIKKQYHVTRNKYYSWPNKGFGCVADAPKWCLAWLDEKYYKA